MPDGGTGRAREGTNACNGRKVLRPSARLRRWPARAKASSLPSTSTCCSRAPRAASTAFSKRALVVTTSATSPRTPLFPSASAA